MDQNSPTRICSTCGAFLARDNRDAICSSCSRGADPSMGPPTVPATFWSVAHMTEALATWHLGKVLAAYRTHPFHQRSISQGTVGAWVGLSQSEVSRIETGPPVKNLDKLQLWARTLRVPADLLWFKLPAPELPHGTAPVDDRPPPSTAGLREAFPVLNLEELRQLSHALEEARYFDEASVAFLERQLAACAAYDGADGPRQALPQVLALLATIERHAHDVRPSVRRDFVLLGSRAAELVGWLYRDLGSDSAAEHWRDRAFEWAAEVGDLPMCGYVLLRKSQAAWDRREATKMLSLADAAQSRTWNLPARVRAEAAQQQARGHAMLGSSPDLVARKLDEAWSLLGRSDDADSDLGAGYDETLLTMQTAICHCEAGDAAKAVDIYGALLSTAGFSRRDRGYFLALLALAYEGADAPAEAARTATEAVSIAWPADSKRTLTELRRLNSRLSPWAQMPEVLELREALVGVP